MQSPIFFAVAIALALPLVTAQVRPSEISSIDFASMIGGPLSAVIKAQSQAAMTTVDFINAVGFNEDREVINVDFKYTGTDENGTDVNRQLTVPFLAMLPIPSIEIEEATVEFNAKINSVTASSSSQSSQYSSELGVSGGWFVKVNYKSSFSAQQQSKNSNTETREYSMRIFVKARQAPMPEGLKKILDILHDAIKNRVREDTEPVSE